MTAIPCAGDLVLCDGCRASFHLHCLSSDAQKQAQRSRYGLLIGQLVVECWCGAAKSVLIILSIWLCHFCDVKSSDGNRGRLAQLIFLGCLGKCPEHCVDLVSNTGNMSTCCHPSIGSHLLIYACSPPGTHSDLPQEEPERDHMVGSDDAQKGVIWKGDKWVGLLPRHM